MGILNGPMTARRFRVVGDVPPGFRDLWRDRLRENAFHEPLVEVGKEEVEGWVNVQNLLDTEFEDLNRWLFGEYALFALRVDKKSLPAKLFAATLAKRCEAWCTEHQTERCPNTARTELKERLEEDWLKRALPRCAVTEACWNVAEGWLLLHSHSDKVVDRFRKRFHRTFDLDLAACSPLDWLDDPKQVDAMLAAPPAALTGGAE